MKRLSREGLSTLIAVAIRVRPKYQRTSLSLFNHAVDELTDDLVNRIMGSPESETVILRPDMIGDAHNPRRAVWDADEPHPHPDLPAIRNA